MRKKWRRRSKEGGREVATPIGGLTLHPLLPLALLFVLLLEFGNQARVHVPGLRNGALLVLLYTGQHTNASGQRQISQQRPRRALPLSRPGQRERVASERVQTMSGCQSRYGDTDVLLPHGASLYYHQLYETTNQCAFKALWFDLMGTEV